MFEQLVRPFQSRQIGTTRRIVPVKVDDTPDEAKIAWGSVGELPQGAVQPKGVNTENIESVGFNLRGSIDNFHQSSRESDFVDVPIRDAAGNQIGSVTLDRAKSITYNKKGDPYLNQFGYNPDYGNKQFTYDAGAAGKTVTASTSATAPAGMRANVPSSNVSQRTDVYVYP
ncbi:MAG TPA: hypothetical protein VJ890_21165 [Vineibacter sp.]|nr:hypothetical protein [Vineibacter sp.]